MIAMALAGCTPAATPTPTPTPTTSPTPQPTQTGLTEPEAKVIAEATCIKGGESLAPGYYNINSKTWWFDANLNATRPGCNPACVISEETKTAEINWRCTGAKPDDETKVTLCTATQRDAEVCMQVIQPVCATVQIQCIRAPCNPVQQTFNNACEACRNSLVQSYTEGTCAPDNINQGSGVRGQVTLGPTCPVQRNPPDPNCADRSYQTTIQVIAIGSPKNSPFTTVQTDNDGKYQVMLPPGAYGLQPVGGNPFPRCATTNVTVEPNVIKEIDLSCDTGIR